MYQDFSFDNNELLEMVERIAYMTAQRYADMIPHLDFEDVVGELILAQICAIKQNRYRPFLKRVAKNRAIDLARLGECRRHDELDRVVLEGDDGEELTLGDVLAANGDPDLTVSSAEDEYLLIELRQRIEMEIPPRALQIGWRYLLGLRSTSADHTFIWSFRKRFPPANRKDLFDYYIR